MGKMGEPIKARAMMYNAVFRAVLLYGNEICTVMDAMMVVLEGFHHSIFSWVTGMTASIGNGG